jgi:hypothetical protein
VSDGEELVEDNTSKVYVGRAGSLLSDALLAPGAGSVPGTSLFVINLCTSIAPVNATGKSIPGLESHKLYQVARSEDGRTRHRLRLGFFASQEDADQALAMVRDSYPTAFTTSLSDDDRKFARGFIPDTSASGRRPAPPVTLVEKTPAPAPKEPVKRAAPMVAAQTPAAPAVRVTTVVAAPAAHASTTAPTRAPSSVTAATVAAPSTPASTAAPTPRAAAPIPSAPKPAASAVPAAPKQIVLESPPAKPTPVKAAPTVIELSLAAEPEALTEGPIAATTPASPFHVGKGVDIPSVSLTLEAAPVAPVAQAAPQQTVAPPVAKKPSPIAEPQIAQKKPAAAAIKPTPPPAPAATASVTRTVPPVPRSQREADRPMPELDSTQTIRALTSAELNDDSQEKWFAIQLAISEQPVNLDAMPHLDIFEAYRLYSIANAGSGKIMHSLRIGFFREQVSAEAVAGYLRTFFASPSVLRISTAEHLRFLDAPAPRTSTANARSETKVVELNQARERAKPTIPTVTMEVPTPQQVDPNATGSFKPNATGSFKATSTGSHKALKQAAKSAVNAKRSSTKTSVTGKHKVLPKKSLQEQLLDEAREVQLSESAIRKLPKNDSLLSRLVGKLTK